MVVRAGKFGGVSTIKTWWTCDELRDADVESLGSVWKENLRKIFLIVFRRGLLGEWGSCSTDT